MTSENIFANIQNISESFVIFVEKNLNMIKPTFISITDFRDNVFHININHIISISESVNYANKHITSVVYYLTPNCNNPNNIATIRTPEPEDSIFARLESLSSQGKNQC